jgi:hypothetical protein
MPSCALVPRLLRGRDVVPGADELRDVDRLAEIVAQDLADHGGRRGPVAHRGGKIANRFVQHALAAIGQAMAQRVVAQAGH